jgi:DNA-directed RNA polymerase subunit alpha
LVLRIWTNGSVSPKESLEKAAQILAETFTLVYKPKEESAEEQEVKASPFSDELRALTIDELDLPTRIYNSLRNGGIETVGELLETPRKELISMRNMGGKSLSVIEEKLQERGASLNL